MHKLPVMATAKEAYRFLLNEFSTIVRLSWLPLLIVEIVNFVAGPQLDGFGPGSHGLRSPLWWLTGLVVQTAGASIVAVALHRVILFGDRQPGRFARLAFGKPELLFVLLPLFGIVAFALVGTTVMFPFWGWMPGFLLAVIAGCAVIGIIWLMLRLSLIFPIIVVEQRYDFRQSWKLTEGNGWQILGVGLVVFIPFLLVSLVIAAFILPAAASELTLVAHVFAFVVSIISGALGVAVLSYSYKALNGRGFEEVLLRD